LKHEIKSFCNITKAFAISFDPFQASLLNKSMALKRSALNSLEK